MEIIWEGEDAFYPMVLKVKCDTVVQYLVLPLCLERGVLRVANIPAGLAVPTSEAPVKVKDQLLVYKVLSWIFGSVASEEGMTMNAANIANMLGH